MNSTTDETAQADQEKNDPEGGKEVPGAGVLPAVPPPPTRRRLGLKQELLLAFMPTATILLVLAFVEALTQQRLLFASLASSAFLIYLDPQSRVNSVRTLAVAQTGAAAIGLLTYWLLGPGYWAAGSAMVLAIIAMVSLNSMHPPAVATALSFGLRAGDQSNVMLFAMAVGMTAVLLLLQRAAVRLARHDAAKELVEERAEERAAER